MRRNLEPASQKIIILTEASLRVPNALVKRQRTTQDMTSLLSLLQYHLQIPPETIETRLVECSHGRLT